MLVKNCENCRWWSDLVARKRAECDQIEALCLCAVSPRFEQWTSAGDACARQAIGESVDLRKGEPRC